MKSLIGRKGTRLSLLTATLLFGAAFAFGGDCSHEPLTITCLEDLRGLGGEQLQALFTCAPLGEPFTGLMRGRLVYLTDKHLNGIKLRIAGSVWRGKAAEAETGYFVNRWIGNVFWIDSHFVIGPSWIDGKPAVVMEYPPGTALFWNMHDELREVAPGLYLGPVFERFPCPKLRGYVALQKECVKCRETIIETVVIP